MKEKNTRTQQLRDDNRAGNFDMGTWFGDVKCVHRHPIRLFNIGRQHWVACDVCKTYIHVGANLMSGWRQGNRHIWEKNWQRIAGYREVVWDTPARTRRPRARAISDDEFCQKVSEMLST